MSIEMRPAARAPARVRVWTATWGVLLLVGAWALGG